MMNLNYIAQFLGYPISPPIKGISIDTRQLQPGDLFVALRGPRFDGHDFVQAAEAKGAAAVLCESLNAAVKIPQLVAPNALQALTNFAKHYRQTISCPVIALTGSNGKTTVKEMIAAILPRPSHATQGNFNNHIGVPLSVLQLTTQHRYAVFELGANHAGEIAHTVNIVRPQVALINNIAPAHIEGFGSLRGVAQAKGEIYAGLEADGVAVINDDDEFAHFWDEILLDKTSLRFSLTKKVDSYAEAITWDAQGCAAFLLTLPLGQAKVQLKVPGEHSIRNALAAATCCYAAGIGLPAIVEGLNHFRGVVGRLTHLPGKKQALIIDDTYNANLRSVLTAIDVLASRQGCRILVLGDMGELGDWSQEHHAEIGLVARKKGINLLLTYGKYSKFSTQAFGSNAKHYASQDALAQDLLSYLNNETTVLIKGSRSATMEKIVDQLVD